MSFEDDTGQLLTSEVSVDRILTIGEPPVLELPRSVPEDVWGAKAHKAKKTDEDDPQGSLL